MLEEPPPYRPLYGQRRAILVHAKQLTLKLLRNHWRGTLATLAGSAIIAFGFTDGWEDFAKALLLALALIGIACVYNLWKAPVEIIEERERHIKALVSDRDRYVGECLTPPPRVAEDLAAIRSDKHWEKDGLWLVRAIAESGARGLSHADMCRLYGGYRLDEEREDGWVLAIFDTGASDTVHKLVMQLMDRSIVAYIEDEGKHLYTDDEIAISTPDDPSHIDKLECKLHQIPRLFYLTQRGMEVWRWSFVMTPGPFVWPRTLVSRTRGHQIA